MASSNEEERDESAEADAPAKQPEENVEEDPAKKDKSKEDKGKEAYSKGDYAGAIKAWTQSLQSVKYILDKSLYKDKPKELQEVHEMELRFHVNMAQGYLKLEEWNNAISSADKALGRDPDNAKALYRKASAYVQIMSFKEAIETLRRLLEVEPGNAAAKVMLAEAKHSNAESKQEAKKMSKRMLSDMISEPDSSSSGISWHDFLPPVVSKVLQKVMFFLLWLFAEIRKQWELLVPWSGQKVEDKCD